MTFHVQIVVRTATIMMFAHKARTEQKQRVTGFDFIRAGWVAKADGFCESLQENVNNAKRARADASSDSMASVLTAVARGSSISMTFP